MYRYLKPTFLVTTLLVAPLCIGCGDGTRRVEETSEYSFDDMAAQAAADTALSEVEE